MKLEYISKSQEYDSSGQAATTKILLGNTDGAIVPVFLLPDVINLSNSELYELAMDKHYQDNFPQRAEKEKFAEQEQALAEARTAIAELKEQAITEIKVEIKKDREMVKTVTLMMNAILEKVEVENETDATDDTTEE